MTLGRPTNYTPELLERAWAYVDGGWIACGDKIPSIAGLACEIGVRRETCHVWAKEEGKEDFSNILGVLMEKQERVLANSGLSGDFNSTITKLILTKHGYSDKVESDIRSPDGSMSPPSTIEIVAKTIPDDQGAD